MDLSTSVQQLPHIGPIYQKKLKKLKIKTVGELLFHFPYRYEDLSNIINISQAKLGEKICVQGKILEIESNRSWKKRMSLTHAVIEDKTGAVKATWFNQPFLAKTFKKGDEICLSGELVFGTGEAYLDNPIYEKIHKETGPTHTGRIVPIYPETVGLSSRWLRYILKPLLTKFKDKIPETLPDKTIKEHKLLSLNKALWQIHFPDSLKLAQEAQARFSFEELFLMGLVVLRERMKLAREKAYSVPFDLELVKKMVNSLPFKLTDSQRKSIWQILKDMEKPQPMNRLLEGDVGSGKTIVAAIATLLAAKSGCQIAFMAPTEILAKQHFQEITRLLFDFKVDIGILTGKTDQWRSKKLRNQSIEISRQKILKKTVEGEIDILIGTHALIQDKVKFKNLALVILDEQHRFGVKQRAKLVTSREKIPHLLSMTATPIPRTLSLTIYGDLDLSLIKELPKGRKKIITKIVSPAKRQEIYEFIRKEISKKRQAFVICPRIEQNDEQNIKDGKKPSSWAGVKAVEEEYEKLSKKIFPDLEIAIIHGKIATKEKDRIMQKFQRGKIDILVSTSVVEVGVDIPNATVMMIEGSERFGLAQLHQLRGRVGRSEHQSFCFLFADSYSIKTRQRLKALITCENGFALAEKDLEIRGPGDFSGTRQWGLPDLAMKALSNLALIEKTRQAAKEILEEDPLLKKYPLLVRRLSLFEEKVHLE